MHQLSIIKLSQKQKQESNFVDWKSKIKMKMKMKIKYKKTTFLYPNFFCIQIVYIHKTKKKMKTNKKKENCDVMIFGEKKKT